MLNLSGLTITEFDDNLFTTGTRSIATLLTWLGFAHTGVGATHYTRRLLAGAGVVSTVSAELLASTGIKPTLSARHSFTTARCVSTGITGVWREWLTVPLGVSEVIVGFDKIKDREEVLALIHPSATTNDLLKLNHIIAGAHQHNVTYITSINTC